MRLKFQPPLEHADCPYRQVHYGHDFSGGAVCDVTDELHARKLLGSGHFVRVVDEAPKLAKAAESPAAESGDFDLTPMRRRSRKRV